MEESGRGLIQVQLWQSLGWIEDFYFVKKNVCFCKNLVQVPGKDAGLKGIFQNYNWASPFRGDPHHS